MSRTFGRPCARAGLVLVSAAAEDSPSTYDDGPVVGSALALTGVVDPASLVTGTAAE